MYKSGMTAQKLFEILRGDVDISIAIDDNLLLLWLNALQQMLYSEIVREQRVSSIFGEGDAVPYSQLARAEDESMPEARDIIGVFADNVEAQRVSGGIGRILHGERPAWYDGGSAICMMLPVPAREVQVAHVVRPATATITDEVCVPPEFLPMVLSRLRGEVYRVSNEDGLASKWLADFNVELETFKVWCASHREKYGM